MAFDCLSESIKAARKYGLPDRLIYGIVRIESSCRPSVAGPRVNACGRVGTQALGIVQIVPGCHPVSPQQALDPYFALNYCAQYIARMYGKFGSYALAVATWHAGETRVRKSAPCIPGTKDQATDLTTFNYVQNALSIAGLNLDIPERCGGTGQPNQVPDPTTPTTDLPTDESVMELIDQNLETLRKYLILGAATLLIVVAFIALRK